MAFGIGKLFGLGILMFVIFAIVSPMVSEVTGVNSTQTQSLLSLEYNITGIPTNSVSNSINSGYLNNRFNLLNNLALHNASNANQSTGAAGSFFSDVSSSIGLGFILSSIGSMVYVFENLGTLATFMLNSLVAFLPVAIIAIPIIVIIKLLALYAEFKVVMTISSAWMKYNLLE